MYIFDYEFCKMIQHVELESGDFPTAIEICDDLSLLMIATNMKLIYFLSFDMTNFEPFKSIGRIDLSEKYLSFYGQHPPIVNQMLFK